MCPPTTGNTNLSPAQQIPIFTMISTTPTQRPLIPSQVYNRFADPTRSLRDQPLIVRGRGLPDVQLQQVPGKGNSQGYGLLYHTCTCTEPEMRGECGLCNWVNLRHARLVSDWEIGKSGLQGILLVPGMVGLVRPVDSSGWCPDISPHLSVFFPRLSSLYL
jgi:hypothetical protein